MRRFECERCHHGISFSAQECPRCRALLGYIDTERTLRTLTPAAGPAEYRTVDDPTVRWRCLNSSWGCNWMLPASAGTPWCRSCQMTRGRPDEGRPDAIDAWMTAEAAKRRLVHQLDELGLPIEIRSTGSPDGLAFDLVDVPGQGEITGHLDGVITLDLAETEEQHRDDLRRLLGEPFRTVIGHLRHEIGHYYWNRLVAQTDRITDFRQLFGDERQDYRASIEHHYTGGNDDWDPTTHVTAYAASHPLEDYAECFAHYLHILDALDTTDAHHLTIDGHTRTTGHSDTTIQTLDDFNTIVDTWRPINAAINAVAESLGTPAIYPFDPAGLVVDKLDFIHRQVTGHVARHQFYESH